MEELDTTNFNVFCESYEEMNEGIMGRTPEESIAKALIKLIKQKSKDEGADHKTIARLIYNRLS